MVLKGRDLDLGRDVALKVLRAEHEGNRLIARRLVDEARIGGQLQHPGILPVYELGWDGSGRPFFAMKLVRGRTLATLLQGRAASDGGSERCLGIIEQVGHAMAYAHARGVIHRDLKPSNVMVGSYGEVQVVDWGLAKILPRAGSAPSATDPPSSGETAAYPPPPTGDDSSVSEAGSVVGTPSYMPPEQARGEVDRLDERADVFALGAILCEVLTGRPPYEGTRSEVLEQARAGRIGGALDRLDACGAAAELISLAKRCLQPDRDARPGDAGEVARTLQAHRESLAVRARTAEVEAARAEVRVVAERRMRRLAVALAGVILLASAIGGSLYLRAERARCSARRRRGSVPTRPRWSSSGNATHGSRTPWSCSSPSKRRGSTSSCRPRIRRSAARNDGCLSST